MAFSSAKDAEEWQSSLESLYEIDPDAAERVAYAGDRWRETLAEVQP